MNLLKLIWIQFKLQNLSFESYIFRFSLVLDILDIEMNLSKDFDFWWLEFDFSYLGYENCLFTILSVWELLEWNLVKFPGRVEVGISRFRDVPINRMAYPFNRTG